MSFPTAEDERRESVNQIGMRLVRSQAAERALVTARHDASVAAWAIDPTRGRPSDVTP